MGVAAAGSRRSPAIGLESVLVYNGLIFNDRRSTEKYRVVQITGMRSADIRDSRENNPSDHGETPFDNYLGGRTILITGKIEAYNKDKLEDMETALVAAMYSMFEKPLYFHKTGEGFAWATTADYTRSVFINARLIEKIDIVEVQSDTQHFRNFSITMRASDPRYRSVIEHVNLQNLGLTDANPTTSVAQWTVVTGLAPTSSGGNLNIPANATSHLYSRNNLGYRPIDDQVSIKINVPATVTTNNYVAAIVKYIDANNYTSARFTFASATTGRIDLVKYVAGAPTTLGSSATFTIAANTAYWLVAGTTGNIIYGRPFADAAGVISSALLANYTYTLSAGAEQSAFGTGIQGGVGIQALAVTVAMSIDNFTVEPLSLNNQVLTLNNVGNFIALPKIRIYGPMTNVTVRNDTLMPDETVARKLVINGSIPAGRYYEYDVTNGTMIDDTLANKFSQVDTTTKQLQIRDGTNLITIIAATTSGITPAVQITFNDTWV